MVYDYAARTPARRDPSRGRTPRGARSDLVELQRLAGNRAVTGLIESVQRDDADDIYDAPPPEKVTGYLGLNPQARKEVAGLRNATRDKVLVSLNDPVAEAKLKESPAVMAFVGDELGIDLLDDYRRWDRATDILLNADPSFRDQLADLMRWFNRAEQGEITLERLVLSGHSNGVELWGDAEADAGSKPGTMVFDKDLKSITEVFPSAAGQVEDVMFSACFSINAVELVIKMFPNLKNCWSYSSFSPDIAGGSATHIATFAAATEGEGTLRTTDKRGSGALWTREKGYIVGDPSAAAVGPLFTQVIHLWRETVEPMYQGDKKEDVEKPVLDPIYDKIQELLAHPGATGAMRKAAQTARDVTLRLRFWKKVRARFGTEYATQLQSAYDALGLPQPDWPNLKRWQLKGHLDEVDKAIKAHPDQGTAKTTIDHLVKDGLLRLDVTIIKPDWI